MATAVPPACPSAIGSALDAVPRLLQALVLQWQAALASLAGRDIAMQVFNSAHTIGPSPNAWRSSVLTQ